MSNIKYLSLVLSDPEVKNRTISEMVADFIAKNGQKVFEQILYSRKHHVLKARRTADYRVSPEEEARLLSNSVLITGSSVKRSFGSTYLELYNNDMPVFITSDSMLHAFHCLYDSWLEAFEAGVLMKEFLEICKAFLRSFRAFTEGIPNDGSPLCECLSFLELFASLPMAIFDAPFDKFGRSGGFYRHSKEVKHFDGMLKFNTLEKVQEMLDQIAEYSSDISITVLDSTMTLNGTTFKPRGHYAKRTESQKFFVAFTWLAKLNLPLRNDAQPEDPALETNVALAAMIAKICEPFLPQLLKLEGFLAKLIGVPDNYVVSSLVHAGVVDTTKSLQDLFEMRAELKQQFALRLTERSKLTKMGDVFGERETSVSFSLIGESNAVDNVAIAQLLDKHCDMRKYVTVLDVVYTLYRNDAVLPNLRARNEGAVYEAQLERVRAQMESLEVNSLYTQQLAMIRALSDRSAAAHVEPFNSEAWGKKQAQTQAGHYTEMRHDNVLYLDEVFTCTLMCEFPDVMVEPVPAFWSEMEKAVDMLCELHSHCPPPANPRYNDPYIAALQQFKTVLGKFQQFLASYLKGTMPDARLVEELKCIVHPVPVGSGGQSSYEGWYGRLFVDKMGDVLDPKAEVASLMTAPPDLRDAGGIVHLGTAGSRLMYVVVREPAGAGASGEQKLFLGPVYNVYEFRTAYTDRLNDEEWAQRCGSYTPMKL